MDPRFLPHISDPFAKVPAYFCFGYYQYFLNKKVLGHLLTQSEMTFSKSAEQILTANQKFFSLFLSSCRMSPSLTYEDNSSPIAFVLSTTFWFCEFLCHYENVPLRYADNCLEICSLKKADTLSPLNLRKYGAAHCPLFSSQYCAFNFL